MAADAGKSVGDAVPSRGVGAPQATGSSMTTINKTTMWLILLTSSSHAHSAEAEPSVQNPGR